MYSRLLRSFFLSSATDVLRSLFILFSILFIITTMLTVRRCEDEDEDDDDDEDDELLLRYMIKELISSL
jgi:hypothetical protein